MVLKLLAYLKHQLQVLDELIRLAQRQKTALLRNEISELSEVSQYQEQVAKSLAEIEEARIRLLVGWLGISADDAKRLRLSQIESKLDSEEKEEIAKMRLRLKGKMNQLAELNRSNRIMASRATRSVGKILKMFSENGGQRVCNVKI